MRRSPRLLSSTPSTVASDKGNTKEAKEGADQTKEAPAGTAGRDLAEKPRDFDEVGKGKSWPREPIEDILHMSMANMCSF
ncbi:hypothetical protein Pmar_PMAR003347 [Perkinsus marinus ATCC 50983]|uniref:Uncharacterized protein n=1 Tax=Perkinsus marinus (strain ATCC 50983 / TXsc) TaxID=423536 RepID=C5KH28_PERM5|nr:hypothetical protein Pmar_PMAR003347 [Perkinsus marinus ATCC 50983]EER15890.1 hypothetical protein Pmar_PMAR003347 [Perkinsus marinus ATCC 50983]|eukprot:XP_002784094.1 hypothetical protein Pmar_PMAR003347 [Perkinsus marinus ATCC 50983]